MRFFSLLLGLVFKDFEVDIFPLFSMYFWRILIPYIALSFSHGDREMERTLLALDKSFGVIKKAIEGKVDDYLESEVVKPVFRKYN